MNYYVARNGQTFGPYSEETIRKDLADGSLLPMELGRTEAMSNWVPLKELLDTGTEASSPHSGAARTIGQSRSLFSPEGTLSKRKYLDAIRVDSVYPTYRGFIGVIAAIGYVVAGIVALVSVVGGLASMNKSGLSGMFLVILGLIYSAIMVLVSRFFKEAAQIIADIGDSLIDANSRDRSIR
jgi:hypothetical protein